MGVICLTTLAVCAARPASANSLLDWCDHCDVSIGVGTTFSTWAWTDGLVLPVTFELQDSRWELGAFRFATAQNSRGTALPATTRAADPYWGFTAMRRWQVLHRRWGKLYVGFGANYRTELDYLESTHWNFAYLIAVRFELNPHDRALELGVRHWSDAWIKPPNRGQNLLTLSFVF
jgi:Lipid A 3-O-deacylase (PagL)